MELLLLQEIQKRRGFDPHVSEKLPASQRVGKTETQSDHKPHPGNNTMPSRGNSWDFPGGTVDTNPPANAEDREEPTGPGAANPVPPAPAEPVPGSPGAGLLRPRLQFLRPVCPGPHAGHPERPRDEKHRSEE